MRRALAVLLGLLGVSACIIPDREIGFEGEFDNPGAVRIVQSTLLPAQMREICEAPEPRGDRTYCPQVPRTLHSGLIGLANEPFCVCPSGQDTRVLPEFFIYAEDPDRASELPVDELFAVALLDFELDPNGLSDDPQNSVAYRQQLPADRPPELISNRNDPSTGVFVAPSLSREDNALWRFRFGKDGGGGTDLCNDNDGRALTPGLHNITVMVTDRPFFRPELLDAEGEPVLDEHGDPILGGTQLAMPDLAAGATYAVANWVFECKDPAMDDRCACVEAE